MRTILHLKNIFTGRFIYLLICMVMLFLIYPFLDYHNFVGQFFLEAIYLAVLLACLRVVTHDKKPLRTSVFLMLLLTIAVRVGGYIHYSKVMLITGLAVEIAFHFLLCIVIIGHVVKTEEVTADKIIGAVCAYLFVGVFFALLFAMLEVLSPGSFAVSPALALDFSVPHGLGSGVAFLYFSFITMTTVGYGDMTPVSKIATSLSALEAVAGQIYLTVLVARLVALNITCARHSGKNLQPDQ